MLETVEESDLFEQEGRYFKKGHDDPFTGNAKMYFSDGVLSSEGGYKNGLRHGEWVEYWKNTKVRSTGFYAGGEFHGKWVWFEENGKLIKRQNYKCW